MQEKIKIKVLSHAEDIIKIFNLKYIETENDKLNLCRKLRRLESKAHTLTTNYCNGDIDGDQYEIKENEILNELNIMLNFRNLKIPCFLNGDCRGYALKIKDHYVRDNNLKIQTDFGGYGLIAPDLS